MPLPSRFAPGEGLRPMPLPSPPPDPHHVLKSFPDSSVTLPPQTHILQPQGQGLHPQDRATLLAQCVAALGGALIQATAQKGRPVERLLLVLPDKTRTQMAANLLLDGVIALAQHRYFEQVTLLYGLATHPLMEGVDIEGLISRDRLWQLAQLGVDIVQQTTKAITTSLTFVSVWQPQSEAITSHHLLGLKDPLLMAWGSASQRDLPLWLGCFPQGVTVHLPDWVALLTALHQHRPAQATPLEIDCRDPHLTQRLNAALPPEVAAGFRFHTHTMPWGHEGEQGQEVRLLDWVEGGPWSLYGGDRYTIEVPELLFTHDVIVVAGDTRIHPYEGRYGSGGVNKMLAVGLSSLNEIRRSHSTRVLMNPLTRVGESRSPFVQRIAATARSIQESLLSRPGSRTMTHPFGLTVIGSSEKSIWRMAFGQDEQLRQPLAHTLTQRYTVPLTQPLDVVISDVELHKGTDITAGARALQYLCDWHQADNVLLNQVERGCVALLFNPCQEMKNNQGIGNEGTKLHMDRLGEMLQQVAPQVRTRLGQLTSVAQARQFLTLTRQTILERWQHHLCSVSEATEWLGELHRIARTGYYQARQGEVTRNLGDYLREKLERYGRGGNHVNRAIAQIGHQFHQTGDWQKLFHDLGEARSIYQEHEGLGEGGQRTLRLLRLCRTFMTLGIATRQPAVIAYIQWLDPDLTDDLHPTVRHHYQRQGLRASILGLVPLDLQAMTPTAAVTTAISYGHWHKPEAANLSIGFLTHPIILRRL